MRAIDYRFRPFEGDGKGENKDALLILLKGMDLSEALGLEGHGHIAIGALGAQDEVVFDDLRRLGLLHAREHQMEGEGLDLRGSEGDRYGEKQKRRAEDYSFHGCFALSNIGPRYGPLKLFPIQTAIYSVNIGGELCRG